MSNPDIPKTKQLEKSTKQQVQTDLDRLKKSLEEMGGKIIPHPGGIKVSIYPTPV